MLSSPLVSMATWQRMKDGLLALKFLAALMEKLQEVNSSLCYRLERMLKSGRVNIVCLRLVNCCSYLLHGNKTATD